VGYELFGVLEDRPPGHRYYYLKKSVTRTDGEQLPITINPKEDDVRLIVKGLRAHTLSNRLDMLSTKITLHLRDSQHTIVGGLLGSIYWGWLDLQTFWIDVSARDQGYGKQLLTMAEQITRENGSPHIFTDVVDLQNLPFFLKQGFKTFTTLSDRPLGHQTHFLRKDL
jgi:ribosomal protein S18 acetylase RimI-like enzyme